MPTLFIRVLEETGEVTVVDPGIDGIALVMGVAEKGDLFKPNLFGKSNVVTTYHGVGPAPRALGHIIKRGGNPGGMLRLPSAVDGSYGTIDVTGVEGTALVSVNPLALPLDEAEIKLLVTRGGTIGEPGIKVQWSVTNGRNFSGDTALGTGYSFEIPGLGAEFLFEVPVAGLVAFVNDIVAVLIAHGANTGGTFHTVPDAVTITAPTATNLATAITRINAARVFFEAHRIKTSGTVHSAPDTTSAIVAPVATDGQTAITLALDIAAKLIIHFATGVHALADAVNEVTAAEPSRGTLITKDVISVKAFAPKWSSSDFAAAFVELGKWSGNFAILYIPGAVSAADAAAVKAGLLTLREKGKRITCILHARTLNEGETELQWIDSLDLEFGSFTDDSVAICAGTAWVTDVVTGRIQNTTFAHALVARLVKIPRATSPAEVARGPLEDVSIIDGTNSLIGHDEAELPGLSDNRFVTLLRLSDPNRSRFTYVNFPFVMRSPEDRIFEIQVRRVANALEREVSSVSFSELGGQQLYDPATGLLDEGKADAIAAKLREVIVENFQSDFQNYADEEVVKVDRAVTIVGQTVYIAVTVDWLPFLYVGGITLTFAVRVR
jgi:hypothetical protein